MGGTRALGVAIALSATVHAAPIGVELFRTLTHVEPVTASVTHHRPEALERGIAFARVPARRRELVERARAELRRNELALGKFLIEASALDADERREPLDTEHAKRLYAERVARLSNELRTLDVVSAVRSVFGDLQYVLTTTTLAGTLLDQGGNCEGLSHTIVAAVHDSGRPGWVGLRYWGGAGGAAHIAPVHTAIHRGAPLAIEYDLVAGGVSHPGGRRFEANDLVEGYARTHGVDGRKEPASGGGGPVAFLENMRPWMEYPENSDVFPGALPIYAERAIGHAWSAGTWRRRKAAAPAGSVVAGPAGDEVGFPCVTSFRDLFRPTVTIFPEDRGNTTFAVEVEELYGSDSLAGEAMTIAWYEKALARTREPLTRLGQLTCLSGYYERSAVHFAAYGRAPVVRMLLERKQRHMNEARTLVKTLDLSVGGAIAARLDEPDVDPASLVRLPELTPLLLERASEDSPMLLLALVAWPATSAEALARLSKLPKVKQLRVAMVLAFAPVQEFDPYPSHPGAEWELGRVIQAFRALPPEVWRAGDATTAVPEIFAAHELDKSWSEGWQELLRPAPLPPTPAPSAPRGAIGVLHGGR